MAIINACMDAPLPIYVDERVLCIFSICLEIIFLTSAYFFCYIAFFPLKIQHRCLSMWATTIHITVARGSLSGILY